MENKTRNKNEKENEEMDIMNTKDIRLYAIPIRTRKRRFYL